MMKYYKSLGKIARHKSLNCSVYGNPKWYLEIHTNDGEILRGKTATNGAIGYDVLDYLNQYEQFSEYEWTYHYTAKGNIIFDQMN